MIEILGVKKDGQIVGHLKATNKNPGVTSLMALHLKLYELATYCKEPFDIDSYKAKDSLITLSNKVLAEVKNRCKE